MREDNDFNRVCEALSFVPANDREIWYKMVMATKSEISLVSQARFELATCPLGGGRAIQLRHWDVDGESLALSARNNNIHR
jgi:hypothetical protein